MTPEIHPPTQTVTAASRQVTLREVVTARSQELGLTRDQLARNAKVGRSTLFDWLAGTSAPSANGWAALAGALQLPVPDLFSSLGRPLTSLVEQARLAHGWTRGDLAEHAKVSFATVRTLEGGGRVRPDAARRVADVLALPAEFITAAARVPAPAATALGRELERERLARGWTIADLARHLGTARQLVSAWLTGTEPVAARWYPALADLTGLPATHIQALARSDS